MLVRPQVNAGRAVVENEFSAPSVTPEGTWPRSLVSQVFELRRADEVARPGRGALQRASDPPGNAAWDAERKFDLHYASVPDHKQCDHAAHPCAASSHRSVRARSFFFFCL